MSPLCAIGATVIFPPEFSPVKTHAVSQYFVAHKKSNLTYNPYAAAIFLCSRLVLPNSMNFNYPFAVLCFIGLAIQPSNAHAISSISVHIGEVQSPQGAARNVTFDYALGQSRPTLKLKAQIKPFENKSWLDISLACASFSNPQTGLWNCQNGQLVTERIKAPFSLTLDAKTSNEIAADLTLQDASFSDAAGLHAGEKVTGTVVAKAVKRLDDWQWQTSMDWQKGEVFWQPFYFVSGGHQLQASGIYNQQFLTVENANLSLKDVGQMRLSGQLKLADNKIQILHVDAPNLDLAALYPMVLKPLLEKTALNNLEMAGKASFKLDLQNGDPKSFQLDLQNADIADKNGRFALYKVNANLPWDYDDEKTVQLAYESGQLLRLPLGATSITAGLNRYALTALQIKLPVLDGALNLSDVSAAWANNQWHWHLRANVSPISMTEFTQALGWPRMEGKVAATIPLVTYSGGQLSTDGAMSFNVFEGTAAITNLAMQDPLGIAPKLTGNMQFRNLDLGDLTRTFSFGAMEGKLDGDVNNLELANWKPVRFDASFQNSPGSYRKKISQRAVENISSLGGAGAAAAIQRSFLRFFKEFNYAKLGLSCKLHNDICEMGGIESTAQGYVIVKGSGIPSITVLGYNRNVGWGELLGRIQRVTAGNTKPIIK